MNNWFRIHGVYGLDLVLHRLAADKRIFKKLL